MVITKITIQLLIFTFFYYVTSSLADNPTYNVETFGATSDGDTYCTKAFSSAWAAACATTEPATIYVPSGRFMIENINFSGKLCKNKAITFRIDGTLVAPSDYNVIGSSDTWLKFDRVAGVSIYGGMIDGRGTDLWASKNSGKSCPKGATSLAFYNSNNITINGLYSLNSQMFHINIDKCHNVNLLNMKISAPANSPNTDGIHVQQSSDVVLMNSHIGTGDDCVSIGPGASNFIGSLGWSMEEAGVQNVTVKTATFTGTQNGVRLKTWARPSNGFVKDVVFQHVVMVNVRYPIIIDQNYCPDQKNCPSQESGVRVSDIKYEDIHGTSATKVAVKFDCSKTYPCNGITLNEVNLTFKDKPATSSCANAGGIASGTVVQPTSCL
ncbi:hypothetical protein ACJIZ3_017237 [Penstemon smallii]|uniref:Polygalacturonase n=1 Tax=Penstemon smallii TaxID=265156 RepID=A0ABD3SVD1_9LAMI